MTSKKPAKKAAARPKKASQRAKSATSSQSKATKGRAKQTTQKATRKNTAAPSHSAVQRGGQRTMQAARYLWATVTALVIAALLFEPTMIWMIGVGVFMLAANEFSGLWMMVCGYLLACLPATFGLLIATGRFWFSLTHALWIGAIYAITGFLLLERLLTLPFVMR